MSLSPEEQQRILDLASGLLLPDSGMEKHFVMVICGKGRACSQKEKEWLAFWCNQNNSSSSTGPQPLHPPYLNEPEATTSAQPIESVKHFTQPAATKFLDEFDTPADLNFEDEVIFEEIREKLTMLIAEPGSYQSFTHRLALIHEALNTVHAAPPSDIAKQLRVADSKLAPF